jgi:hypothetical protein
MPEEDLSHLSAKERKKHYKKNKKQANNKGASKK